MSERSLEDVIVDYASDYERPEWGRDTCWGDVESALAAEKAKWQAEERERIAVAIDDAARRAAETADPGATAAAMRMAAVAAFDAAARIARQGGSDDER